MKKFKLFILLFITFIFLSACASSYKISFVTNTDEKLDAITYEKNDELNLPTLSREGYDFKGWFLDSDFSKPFENEVTEDITLYAKWDIKTFNVRFMDGSQELKKVTVDYGKDATAPEDPVKEGYKFGGWDKEFKNVTKDLVVYATFEMLTFEVKFMSDGKQVGETQTVDYGTSATAPTNLEKEGYTFKGWDKEFKNVHEDLVVTAVWEVKTFLVTFLDIESKPLETQTVEYGKSATAPTAPTVDGYTFNSWSVDFSNVTKGLTVQAKYDAIEYDIEYYDGDTKLTLTPNKYTVKDDITFPTYEKDGFLFVGWYLNKDLSDESVKGLSKGAFGDKKLYAKVLDSSDVLNIEYELNGGSWSWTTNTVANPAKGIKSSSNLPVIFMQDFYTYLVENNLLQSDVVEKALHKTNWADFSANYDDPAAIYNWSSSKAFGGGYGDKSGYNQFFYDEGFGNAETHEVIELVGGFLGSDGYREKYATLVQHIAYMLRTKYSAPANQFWSGGDAKGAGAFVFDGYLYGTQGLTGGVAEQYLAEFAALRAAIPTPDKGYKYVNGKLESYTYDFLKSEMVNGTEAVLSIPSREGYFFGGWYDNAELTGDRIVKIKEGEQPATKYYAKWIAVSEDLK